MTGEDGGVRREVGEVKVEDGGWRVESGEWRVGVLLNRRILLVADFSVY